ncbi:MAG: LysR family transcriptional regulator [Burkholderiaceae bacterium]|nr:LysR family transcriptional regulator [Burkholderiaceae bacterium]
MKRKTNLEPPAADTGGLALTRPQLAWTDFHTVLAVAQHGSVAKACPALRMTHSTLLRKLDLIESRLKTRLFERTRQGYALTAAGHEIVQAALAFAPIAATSEQRVRGQDLRPSGEVRVSAAAVVIEHLVAPVLAQFGSAFPEIQIELAASREHVNLRRREADVAIRIADSVPDWLLGRRLAELQFRVYGRRRGRANAALRTVEDLAGERRWISFERDARDLKFDRWLAEQVPESNVVLRVDNFSHAATMVRAGLGIALLPAFVESSLPDLRPLSEPIAALQTPLWIVTHPELKDAMRIKVLMRAFGPALANAVQLAQDSELRAT